MSATTIRLRSRAARDHRRVGGKAAHLARLRAAGFPVPDGFVLPVGATGHAGWREAVWRAAARLRLPLAVRSSMVGEDAARQSFAGQLESVLGVAERPQLERAVERVLASAARMAERPYRELGPTPGGMAVLVQELVPARAAGVAFSHDPISGRAAVLIEAVPRLGDELVQGRCAPDRFVVEPRGVLSLEQRHALDVAVLPEAVLLQLAALVRRAADLFGRPQDVEWAWDGERVLLLQARPITSLAEKHIYSRKLVGDMSPGPLKALFWSTNIQGMARGVLGDSFAALTGDRTRDYAPMLHRIRSHAFIDTTFLGQLLAEVGLPRNFFETMGRDEQASRRLKITPGMLARAPRIIAFAVRSFRRERQLDGELRAHEAVLRQYRGQDWSGFEAAELLARADTLLADHRRLQRLIFLAGMSVAIRRKRLNRLVERYAPEADPALLLLGRRARALEPNRALAEIARGTPPLGDELLHLLLEGDDGAVRQALRRSPVGAALLAAVSAFLARFGFLGANGTNFGEPTWAEDPSPVWSALGRLLRDGAHTERDPVATREAVRAQVLERLPARWRGRFEARLAGTTRALEQREWAGLLMTEDSSLLRRLFLALGAPLAECGLLPVADDVFHLQHAELHAAVRGELQAHAAHALVRERRAELEADRYIDLPETVAGDVVYGTLSPLEADLVLTGIPACAGLVTGRACVVRELADVPERLTGEDILVVPFSDVGWTPLFAAAGGIVAECGGQLSHTAIVAREYGIPAVVGVAGALARIRTGQTVAVDGGRGVVVLQADEPEPATAEGGTSWISSSHS